MKKILVTSALPYANGGIHLGHMVEFIQTDIFVRMQKLLGNTCYYVCGDDAHGTPIMLSAEKQNRQPEEMIAEIYQQHVSDLKGFAIGFDEFYTTHSKENQELSGLIYERLNARGDIQKKTIMQAYDAEKNMFLPDRYVKGECPKCGAKDQYGDSCEVCGATYSPSELKNPFSVLSNTTPIQKESEHYFFALDHYTEILKSWLAAGHLQDQVKNKLQEWIDVGLMPWDISRDAPYFGFLIPGTSDKYFYVWLDAPIGYIASFKHLCERNPEINFDEFWQHNAKTELYHFVGKDIIYFHALFWPAMLTGSNFRTPTAIFAHGFLTVDGHKMSKSRGTFINANDYLQHLNPEYLRYYFAAKLTSRIDDLDLNWDDFMSRVNADLVGKFVNIASRSAGFIHKFANGKMSAELHHPTLQKELLAASTQIAENYLARDYAKAIREIMELADKVNQYVDEQKPWALAKIEGESEKVVAVASQCLNFFRILMMYLSPVLPTMTEKVSQFLNCSMHHWNDIQTPLLNHTINAFEPLIARVDAKQLEPLRPQ